ncbi:riboflavin synthase subunit alpha [Natrialba hulunbeirensis JCM 10989]|uniref:Riboflavin synthase subunit alpha n=1 Tax=Natrialba hulunbeirensis JCM 10989 TaxID=1227493 RepID=M0A4L5_9EURY|nr:riboflavin synthase [Natrialba hulunbeirensis]ELY92852.1 riboflavin synthase subunit alpha [Natrialba hulunbeirensis JCM 10989]
MFTGIVEETGDIVGRERTEDGLRLRIAADAVATGLTHGQSISVSGVCLTVERYDDGAWFEVFLATETVERTYLGNLGEGDTVNLERAMPADGRFDGHIVQGHVDAVATVSNIESVEEGEAQRASEQPTNAERSSANSRAAEPRDDGDEPGGDWFFEFELPEGYGRYVVEKGSITLDGISLTVADLVTTEDGRDRVTVAIIPTTYELTTLSEKAIGDPIHLEVDVLSKYVERLLESRFDSRFD